MYNKVENETRLDYVTLFFNNERRFHVVTLESILHIYFLKYKNKYKLKNEKIISNDKKISIMKNCILDIKNTYTSLKIIQKNMLISLLMK